MLPAWTAAVHHDGSSAYVSNPLPALHDSVTFRLRLPHGVPLRGLFLRTRINGESHYAECRLAEHNGTYEIWEAALQIEQPRIEYRFKLLTEEGAYFYSAAGISRADTPNSDDFVLICGYHGPAWVRDAVFYQIFPDSFRNSDPELNVRDGEWVREGRPVRLRAWGEAPLSWHESQHMDFYGGDLPGITESLDYLQALGVDALYLTPIFPARSPHRYDSSSFEHIDPHLGGDAALADLRAALDERSMRLILDITPNHVGDAHHWFRAAKDDPDSPEAAFFYHYPETDTYETWLGVKTLIKLNYGSELLRDRMFRAADSALRRWLRPPYRIDGWRLDVANMTGNLGLQQRDHDVWRDLRRHVKADGDDVYLLGEYFPDATPHLQGDELDAAMNYQGFNTPVRRWLGGVDSGGPFRAYADTVPLPTEALAEQWRRFLGVVPYAVALQQFNQLDSHDTPRILNIVGGDKALVRLGVALLMAFPGVPCLYYGTEIGLDGGHDPDNRRTMPWDETAWDAAMLDHCRRWIALRRAAPALREGGFQVVHAQGDVVAFLRESPAGTVLFAGNRGADAEPRIMLAQGGLVDGTRLRDLLNDRICTVEDGAVTLSLAHGEAALLAVD